MNFPQYDTIALAGLAPSSRDQIANVSDDAAVFIIGAAHRLPAVPRVDACLEIHPLWLLSHENYNPKLRDWLDEAHDFPVYMMEPYSNIPSAVKYPLDAICERFLKHVTRRGKPIKFFTSSFDYLIALALMHNPRRIEHYGYDMSTDTEYAYQAAGAHFWLGYAAGMGVEVESPEETPLLKSRLYAYEGTQAIRYKRISDLHRQAKQWMKQADKVHETWRTKVEKIKAREEGQQPSDRHRDTMTEYGRKRDDYFLKSGAAQALRQLRDDFSLGDIVSRQELERHKSVMQAKYITYQSKLNFWEGVTRDRYVRYTDNTDTEMAPQFLEELHAAQVDQNKARDFFFMHQGAVGILQHLIDECDLQHEKDWELAPNTVEIRVDAIQEE